MSSTFYGCASITDSKRVQIINKDWSLGPASYDPKQEDSQSIPKWTLKPKIDQTSCFSASFKNKNPGPSHYNPHKKEQQQCQKKLQMQRDKLQQQSILAKSIKYERETQRQKQEATKNYENLLKKNFTLLNKRDCEQKKPQKYGKIGTSFGYRDQISDPFFVTEKSPGPIYNVSQSCMKKIGCNWGKSQQNKSKETNTDLRKSEHSPGPGNYQQNPKFYNTTSKWSISKAKKGKALHSSTADLGPGSYDPALTNISKSCTIKGKPRGNLILIDNCNPSPGAYQIPDTKSKKATIFKNGRQQNSICALNSADSPSPFSYNPNDSTLKPGGCTLGKRIQTIGQDYEAPGPGSYEIISQELLWCNKSKLGYNKSIGGHMGRRIDLSKKKALINQDNIYKYDPDINQINPSSPKYSFGQSQYSINLQNRIQDQKLGPGSYDCYRFQRNNGGFCTIPKNPRFKALQKQNISHYKTKKLKNVKQLPKYGQMGYLPSYFHEKLRRSCDNIQKNRELCTEIISEQTDA